MSWSGQGAWVVVWTTVTVGTTEDVSWGGNGAHPAQEHSGGHTQLTYLYYQVAVCASLALGTAHSFLRETSSLLRSSKVGGGCGDFGVHSLTGEKATSVSRVPLRCPEPALEMLPGLEQGGYIQQCILDVPPQPLGVLQRSRQGAREDWEVRGRRLDQGPWRLNDSIPDLGGYGRHSVHLTVCVLDFLLEIWKVIVFSPVKI